MFELNLRENGNKTKLVFDNIFDLFKQLIYEKERGFYTYYQIATLKDSILLSGGFEGDSLRINLNVWAVKGEYYDNAL